MELVLDHLKEHYGTYVVAALCVLPLLYVTKKWSVPIILYIIEISVYCAVMHTTMFLIVAVTRWFKENSSMRALREDGKPLDTPEWGTPWLEFWNTAAYDPRWVIYIEVALVVIILVLVWRYRPLKIQHRKTKRQFISEGGRKNSPYLKNYAEPSEPPGVKAKSKKK